MARTLRRIVPQSAATCRPLVLGEPCGKGDSSLQSARAEHRPTAMKSRIATTGTVAQQLNDLESLLQQALQNSVPHGVRDDRSLSESPAADSSATPSLVIAQRGPNTIRSTAPESGCRRVVLRLNRRTIRVLQGLAASGHRPSRFVDTVLQRDSVFRDAAAIMGIDVKRVAPSAPTAEM